MSVKLEYLKILADDDFDSACRWAENNIDGLNDFFDTWARNCGASKKVFVGHTIKMLINIQDKP